VTHIHTPRVSVYLRLQAARDAAAAASDENNRARGKHAAKALQELLSAPQVGVAGEPRRGGGGGV